MSPQGDGVGSGWLRVGGDPVFVPVMDRGQGLTMEARVGGRVIRSTFVVGSRKFLRDFCH